MARAVRTRRTDRQRKSRIATEMPLDRTNYIIIAGGALLIVVTYVILATNNTVYGFVPLDLVPILLFIGYLVVVPIGIMYRKKKSAEQTKTAPEVTK